MRINPTQVSSKMDEKAMNNDLNFDLPPNKSSTIKVLGVGGGGSNAVNHMKTLGIKDVDYIICNTDAQALDYSDVENKIQLGASLTEGLGAGANPEVGRNAAIESWETIKQILESNTKMLFITAGMGGGTGTGAAPVIAKLSQELDLLTVGVVTMPFTFEGRARMKQAEEGLEELRKHVDSLIIIKNDKLREVYGNLGFKAGFSKADVILATAVKAIAEVITHHYRANIDLEDARRVLANSGTAIMGSASADGDGRAEKAIASALDSPLLNDNHIHGAQNVLLLIISGSDEHEITFDEIGEINEHIQKEAGGNTNIILGIGEDEDLGNKISVTVIATGFERQAQARMTQQKSQKKIIPLGTEEEIPVTPQTRLKKAEPVLPKVEETPKKATPQTNLFEAIEIEKKAQIQPEQSSHPLNGPAPELEEEEEEMLTSFNEELQENEIVFDVTPINNTPEEKTVEQPVFEEVDEVEETEEDQQVSPVNEKRTSFSLDQAFDVEEEEETFSFSLTEEEEDVDDQVETNSKQEFIILDEEEEEIEEPQLVIKKEPVERLDPLNFSIDQVIGKQEPKKEAPLYQQKQNAPVSRVSQDSLKPQNKYTLDDLRELENALGTRNKTVVKNEVVKQPKTETNDDFKVSYKETLVEQQEETSPLEDNIMEVNKKIVLERKNRLQAFTFNFKKHQADLDEPAYKRAGINIQNDGLSSDENLSRMSVNGEGKNTQFGGNSFLHDNVD